MGAPEKEKGAQQTLFRILLPQWLHISASSPPTDPPCVFALSCLKSEVLEIKHLQAVSSFALPIKDDIKTLTIPTCRYLLRLIPT